MKQITASMLDISIRDGLDPLPIKGNASNMGDPRWDSHMEAGIQQHIDNGNYWAWGFAVITATVFGLKATKHVWNVRCPGGEKEFRDMVLPKYIPELLESLNEQAKLLFDLLDNNDAPAAEPSRNDMLDAIVVARVSALSAEELKNYAMNNLRMSYNGMNDSTLQKHYKAVMRCMS